MSVSKPIVAPDGTSIEFEHDLCQALIDTAEQEGVTLEDLVKGGCRYAVNNPKEAACSR